MQVDPPQGVVVSFAGAGGEQGARHEFVGWLGLLGLLQSLAVVEASQQNPA